MDRRQRLVGALVLALALGAPMWPAAQASSRPAGQDATAPRIIEESIVPQNDGNTVFTRQPLAVRILDEDADLEADAIGFELHDTTSGVRQTRPAVSYDPTTGWARTAPVTLERQHHYLVSVTATDAGGNSDTYAQRHAEGVGGFLVVDRPHIEDAGFRIAARGRKAPTTGWSPTEEWIFVPEVRVGARDVYFEESRHPGWGTISSSLPLSGATVTFELEGVRREVGVPGWAGQTRQVYQEVAFTGPNGVSRTNKLDATSVGLPAVRVALPAGATDVRLSARGSLVGNPAGICSDPTAGLPGCSPDPLRFHMDPALAASIERGVVESRFGGGSAEEIPDLSMGVMALLPGVDEPVWEAIQSAQMLDCGESWGYAPSIATCMVDGVLYPESMSVVPPQSFAAYCDATTVCVTAGYAEDRGWRKFSCIYPRHYPEATYYDPWPAGYGRPGQDRPAYHYTYSPGNTVYGGAGAKQCQQSFSLWSRASTTTGAAHPKRRIHIMEVTWDSTWGVQDRGRDALGVHWDTPADKHMRWVPADPADVPYLPRVLDATYGTWDDPYYGGVYPQGAQGVYPGRPDPNAWDAYLSCFNSKLDKIDSEMRVKQPDETGIAYGAGTGYPDASYLKGWQQHQQRTCNGVYYWVRATHASLVVALEQHDKVGRRHKDGHLLASYGHEEKKTTLKWGFKISGPSCGIGTKGPGCDALGISFVEASEESDVSVHRKHVYKAFPYW